MLGLLPWLVQYLDDNGNPLSNGKVFTYVAGTTTQLASYTDSTGATQNTNPVILDASGRANIWLSGSSKYKIILTDANDFTIRTEDNLSGVGTSSSGSGSGSDELVKINSTDLVSQYLDQKIISGPGVNIATQDNSGILRLQPVFNGVTAPYINTTSGLTAVTINAAIDEVDAKVDINSANIATNDTDIANNTAAITANTTLANGKVASVSGGININVTGGTTTPTVNLDTSISDAIALNTAKVGITSTQANAITANTAKVGITNAQANAIALNTAKDGITTAQANAITTNTAKVGITSGQASEIAANTLKTGITSGQATAITTNTAGIATNVTDIAANASAISGLANGLQFQTTWNASTNSPDLTLASKQVEGHYYIVATAGSTNLDGITDWKVGDWVLWSESGNAWQKLDNTSFESVTNQGTGAGVFKGIVNGTEVQLRSLTNGSKISFTQNANDIQINDSVIVGEVNANTAKVGITSGQASEIAANTLKTGISSGQASAITANTAKVGITNTQAANITTNNAKVGITNTQATNITTNNAKTGITNTQATNITTNNAKVGITNAQATAITANTAKDGITTAQANAIVLNTAKDGITTAQANAIVLNTAKVTYTDLLPLSNNFIGTTNTFNKITATGDLNLAGAHFVAGKTTGIGEVQAAADTSGAITDLNDFPPGTMLLTDNAVNCSNLPPTFNQTSGRHSINTIMNGTGRGAQIAIDTGTGDANQMAYRGANTTSSGVLQWEDWIVVAGANKENTFTSAQTINSTLDVTGTIKAGGNGNDATKFLNGTGAYSVPAGGGGTADPVYFRNNISTGYVTGDNYVDFNTTSYTIVPWSGASGIKSSSGITHSTAASPPGASTGRITVTAAGQYDVYSQLYYSSTTQRAQLKLAIYVNGSEVTGVSSGQGGYARAIGSAPNGMSHVAGLLNLNANDYVEIFAKADALINSGVVTIIEADSMVKIIKLQGAKGDQGPAGGLLSSVGGGLLVDLGFPSTNQVITTGNGATTINFDDTVTGAVDKNGDWDNTNKKFIVSTASGAGTYQFETNLFCSNTTGSYYNLQAFVNGVLKTPNGAFAMSDAISDSTFDGVAGTLSLDLDVGDEVEIKLQAYSSTNANTIISANGTWNFAQGMRISKTSGVKGDTGATGAASLVRTVTTTTTTALATDASVTDIRTVTALNGSMLIQNPSGNPINGQVLKFRIKQTASSGTITYGGFFRSFGIAKPTSITQNKTLYLGCIFNSTDTKWDIVAAVEEV